MILWRDIVFLALKPRLLKITRSPELRQFLSDTSQTFRTLGLSTTLGTDPAEIFALIIFLCDGFLQVDAHPALENVPAAKFFNIIRKLPMELQMAMCHRVDGSSEDMISEADRDYAFKELGKKYLESQRTFDGNHSSDPADFDFFDLTPIFRYFSIPHFFPSVGIESVTAGEVVISKNVFFLI